MIGIIDYGLGNISAFVNVYKNLNVPFKIVAGPDHLDGIDRVILPGVGSFDYAMERFESTGLHEPLQTLVINQKVPVLGICVGMQMLAAESEEGARPGLGWIKGSVRRFDSGKLAAGTLLPHMGWNNARPNQAERLFEGLDAMSTFYFLHSYYFECDVSDDVLATTDYGGQFVSAVGCDNVFGVQFHPEKSHQWGIKLLKNFARL